MPVGLINPHSNANCVTIKRTQACSFMALQCFCASGDILMRMQANFLVSGHTHIDVDGLFGSLSNLLKRQDVWTPAEMMAAFRESVKLVADSMKDRGFTAVQDDSVNPECRVQLIETVPNFDAIYNHKYDGRVRPHLITGRI